VIRAGPKCPYEETSARGSTDNPEAYRFYLKGKYNTNKLTKEGFDTGIDYFNQAIAADPNYALAYSGLASNYVNQDELVYASERSRAQDLRMWPSGRSRSTNPMRRLTFSWRSSRTGMTGLGRSGKGIQTSSAAQSAR
jgi:hypothetical protein